MTLRRAAGLLALLAVAVAAATLRLTVDRDPFTGEVGMAWPAEAYAAIRWTALATGALVGAALAISGVLLQALLRNPLASPFILGLSSGAGLGVMAALYVGGAWIAAGYTPPATAGALATLAVVYFLGQRRGVLDPVSLVLIGVVVSTIAAAGIMFFQHLVPQGLHAEFTRWLMGVIRDDTEPASLTTGAAIVGGGLAASVALGRAMDAATLGEDEARSVGLALGPLRAALFVLAGLLAAMSVAMAGPIGFVGLISPHAARLVLGPRHAVLTIGAALTGVIIVVGSDALRQGIDLGAGRMPIGIFTALIGGPAFLWLLLSGRGQA